MDEIGYSDTYSDAALKLIYLGVSTEIINPAKYITSVDVSRMDSDGIRGWQYILFEREN